MKQKSILFVLPDYHCSFFYRDELRRLGWKADIYVPNSYPEKLLYSEMDILRAPTVCARGRFGKLLGALMSRWFYLTVFWRYKYHFYYNGLDQFNFFGQKLKLTRVFGESFRVHLWLAKVFKRKVIHLPSGCLEEETKANFSTLDGGNVCGNCGWALGVCDDKLNIARFNLIRRYADMVVGTGSLDSTQYKATHFKYKAIDLDIWHPGIDVPEKFKLPPTENLRILHSFFNQYREQGGKNIKGSPFILNAIERLKQEGHDVEYMYITDVPLRDMRYYQVQVDIVVEQLIYGWWGSTFIETSALGKPVICYLRPSWKEFFLKTFPEYDELPIIEANTSNIYEVLKKLVMDPEYRQLMGRKSRQFAERHFDSKKNARAMADLLLKL